MNDASKPKAAQARKAKVKAAPAAPASVQPKQEAQMPVFSASTGLSLFWQKASGQMNPEEMEWVADGAAQQVGMNLRALACMVEGTACLVSSDTSSGSFQDACSTSTLLFNLHNQLDFLAGLAAIADDANCRVRLALKGQQ